MTSAPEHPPPEIYPGDWVTVLCYVDGWPRTSTVQEDGSFTGCGAVEQGHAEVVSVYRPIWLREPGGAS